MTCPKCKSENIQVQAVNEVKEQHKNQKDDAGCRSRDQKGDHSPYLSMQNRVRIQGQIINQCIAAVYQFKEIAHRITEH